MRILFLFVCVFALPGFLKLLGTPASKAPYLFPELFLVHLYIRRINQSVKSIIVEHQFTNLCAKLQFMFNEKVNGAFFD